MNAMNALNAMNVTNPAPLPTTAPPDLASRLAGLGDPGDSWNWHKGDRDYVAELALSSADVPVLIATARQWYERTDWPDDPDDTSVYASVHAWRALGQLRAESAVDDLLAMMALDAAQDDDWCLEEFPQVFALIGPSAIDRVAALARNVSLDLYQRIAGAYSLAEIAKRHPDSRPRVLAQLINLLLAYEDESDEFNAFVVSYLMDIRAVEAADLIERVFADDRVELSLNGNWNHVRAELGVEGRGLVPKELAKATWTLVRRRPVNGAADDAIDDEIDGEIDDAMGAEPSESASRGSQRRGNKKRKRKSR